MLLNRTNKLCSTADGFLSSFTLGVQWVTHGPTFPGPNCRLTNSLA